MRVQPLSLLYDVKTWRTSNWLGAVVQYVNPRDSLNPEFPANIPS